MRAVLTVGVVCALAAPASGQRVELSAQSREIYAELPFVLTATAQGFDESPEPTLTGMEIDGAEVMFLGVSPNVSTSISVVNGRRSESRRVTFVFQYRVTVPRGGTHRIPPVTVTQGDKQATTEPATFVAREVTTSSDMKFRVGIPDRPVWVGETFELTLDWYLRKDPKSPSFVVPLFDQQGVEIHAPSDGGGDGTLSFFAGSQDVELPYTRSTEVVDGNPYTRFRFRAVVTPMRPGTHDLPAAKVVSRLTEASGFRSRQLGIFKAEDVARKLEIRPLPLKGRPDSFANAVGRGFSIDVQASRTVVQVGDPVELEVRIRGDAPLEGVSLPDLRADGGLSPELFDIPEDQPPGVIADGGGKTFAVTVRLRSAEAREIPPIAFSYFDPKKSEYQTVRSQPVALSVAGSAIVGARDVVGGAARPDSGDGGGDAGQVSLVGADLALSAESDTLDQPLTAWGVRPILIAIYAMPLLLFGFRVWQARTSDRRAETGELDRRLRDVRNRLSAAATEPGLEVAPTLVAALKALGKATGSKPPANLIEELETQAYNPSAGKDPLPAELRERIAQTARDMARALARPASRTGGPGAAAAGVLLLALISAARAGETGLADARRTYSEAIDESDRDGRTRGFAQAELAFRDLVARYPGRPELLADWGTAALGAQDLGRATLAFRRALYFDNALGRARKNLSWVRERAPSWLAKPEQTSAIDSLFFWHHALTPAQRHIAAALAFAMFVVLIAPWGRRDRLRRRLALLPLAVFVAMIVSVAVERDQTRDAVVVADDVVLRSADSIGAPPALANPLPAGAEGVVLETRDSWTRIGLADGTRGWVPRGVVERVVPVE